MLQLKFYQNNARFPINFKEIPDEAIEIISNQMCLNSSTLESYGFNGRTGKRHRSEILSYFKLRRASGSDLKRFFAWLRADVFSKKLDDDSYALYEAHKWFFKNGMESVASKRFVRLICSERLAYLDEINEMIFASLPQESKQLFDELISGINTSISFGEIKADPGRIGLESIILEHKKLEFINRLHLPYAIIEKQSKEIKERYSRRASAETGWEIRQHCPNLRYALLSFYFYKRQREITDNLVELFIHIVHKISVRAERKVIKEFVKDFKQVNGKNNLLYRIAEASLEEPDESVRNVVYPIVGEGRLNDLVKEFKASGAAYKDKIHTAIRTSYSHHYRRMMPIILAALRFRSNNRVHKPILLSLNWLKDSTGINRKMLVFGVDDADISLIPKKWHSIVVENHNGIKQIDRINYEICILQTLREKLRCKEVWVEGADKYRNPDQDLPGDFEHKRGLYYSDLNLCQDGKLFVDNLRKLMNDALAKLNKSIVNNAHVKIKPIGKNRICISPQKEQAEPTNIVQVKREILAKWPMTSLIDILKETDFFLDFTRLFHSSGARQVIDDAQLKKRLLLCLYGMGTNTGLKRVSNSQVEATYKELLQIRRKYIHKDSLREAISMVANSILRVRNPRIWGEGTSTCASDSKKFGSWDQNLMTEWHIRYGGRGVMIYWHVEKKSTCIYSQLKRCSSSEVASMIEGVLRHCTEMEIDTQYVDSHGQSTVAFCHLLGFNLMPRLKAISSQRLSRISSATEITFDNLEPILCHPIKWDLIEQQYDEMVKYATAMKRGIADPESILRRFTKANLTHPTYKALSELGKVIKTIFLCKYIMSDELRREIHEALNVVENWNSANAFIFYGKGGEVATNRLEEQELSILSLHLLQICMVFVNTLMIEQTVSEGKWLERFTKEDLRAISPMIYGHINPYGQFKLDMEHRLPLDFKIAA